MIGITIHGNTYNHRETLKAMGARWNGASKTWEMRGASNADINHIRKLPGCLVKTETTTTKPSKPLNDDDISFLLERLRATKEKVKSGKRPSNIFGDDVSYHNYFAEQNPVAFFGFSSLQAFVKFIDAVPQHIIDEDRDDRNEGWKTSMASWRGTSSMKECLKLARNGWPKGVEMAEEIVEQLTGRHAIERRRKHTIAGGSLNIGRLLAGNPLHMVSRPKQQGKKIITFFIESVMCAAIEPETMIIRAALVAAVADILQQHGYSCEIISAGNAINIMGYPIFQVVTTLKAAGEPLNLNDIIFAMGHPSYLRRMIFAAAATDEILRNNWDGMGGPTILFNDDHPTKQNELYIKGVSYDDCDKTHGDTLIEKALSIWKLICTDTLPIDIKEE